MTRIGYSGATLEELPRSPRITKRDEGPEVTESFNCDFGQAEAAITTRGFDFGDAYTLLGGIYSDAKLNEIQINKADRAGRNALVIYIWRVPQSNPGTPPVGTLTQEGDANTINIPIGQNPNASPGVNYDTNKKIGKNDWEGIDSFLSPQPVYTRTDIVSSFTFTEAALIEDVGLRFNVAQMTAVGVLSSTLDKWLKVGKIVRTSGTKFEVMGRWQYAANGWNTDIYDPKP